MRLEYESDLIFKCDICNLTFGDDFYQWQQPHKCADNSKVCSEECAKEWCDINWEEVEEYESMKQKVSA